MLRARPESPFARCPACSGRRRDQRERPAQTIEGGELTTTGPGIDSDGEWRELDTLILHRHKDNRSSENVITAATTATVVAGHRKKFGEKEAGAAGGESGARAHGPALGGEAGSVLI
jgi:hypothetical protein